VIEEGDPRWVSSERSWVNLGHLIVVDALLGKIAPEMHAISVDFDGGEDLRLHIALTYDYPEFDQDAADILDEVEYGFARTAPELGMNLRMEVVKHVGDPGPQWPGYQFAKLYRAKEYEDPPVRE